MLKRVLIAAGLLLAVGTAQAAVPGMNGTAANTAIIATAKDQVQPVRYYRRYVVRRYYVVPRRRYYVARPVYRRRPHFVFGF